MERGKRARSASSTLARQGLPLRRHCEQDDSPSNNRGNFLELLQFKLEDDSEKKRWFDNLPENSTYVSPPMQNMFIQIIADQREQMNLYIRFVNKKGDLVERCLALIEVPSTKATDLLEAIHASMKTSQLDKSRHGSPNAIYVHCYVHRLNLVIVELAKSSTLVSKFFATIQGLVVLIGASAKRLHFFTIAQQDELRRLVIDQDGEEELEYEAIVENALKITLVSIGNDAIDAKHVVQAAGLLGQINTFEFILMMHLMIEVLEQTHDLSQLLQRRGQDMGNAAAKVASIVSQLRAMQSDDKNFMKIYDQTEKFAHDNAIVVPDCSETIHIDRSTTVVDWHRINFFYIVLDKVLNELDYRFNASNLTVLKTIRCFMPSFFPQFDSALIKKFVGLYWKPMDLQSTNTNQQRKLDALDRELKAFTDYITMGKFDKLQTMQDVLQLLERDYHDLPMMQALYQIVITIPVSSANPERSFSAMKRILNRLRASMGSQ
ncbi:hypothetical protein BDL97_17G096800 [Sphagnum fallax]|nr:hypothetical protein BDL97_17G096800 [Sphagnum fallax]